MVPGGDSDGFPVSEQLVLRFRQFQCGARVATKSRQVGEHNSNFTVVHDTYNISLKLCITIDIGVYNL